MNNLNIIKGPKSEDYDVFDGLMNTMVSCTTASEPSISRRCSTETVFSIQDRETDFLRDTSDTEWCDSDEGRIVEFEPDTAPEEEGLVDGDSSGNSDNEIISTKVIEILVRDDGDLELADSERSGDSDGEIGFHDYWKCAQCRAENNNPLYRYCEKCFKERKNFFPPRPKRKHKLDTRIDSETISRTLSQDSGVETVANSQEFSQDLTPDLSQDLTPDLGQDQVDGPSRPKHSENRLSDVLNRNHKRRAESADRKNKRIKVDYSGSETDSEKDEPVIQPLVKMISDPSLTVEPESLNQKPITLQEKLDTDNLCIMCYSEPKSGVFVHGRIAHICCCYKCARQVWAKAKRCPVCNCKVSNVLRAVVM
ncbi:E3 ubiquitin-protein ligase Mdm2-like [Epargyreus clarus]|uniref:E3 ubiquitin-protein ligase Mdm2-like n=1 Tax=Epargyreus clarus TaxID=520877 RepID=UPI003C2CC446